MCCSRPAAPTCRGGRTGAAAAVALRRHDSGACHFRDAAGVVWMLRERDRGVVDPVRLAATLPAGVTIPVDTYNVLAISRDGSRAAVVGASGGTTRIYVRNMREFEMRPLAGTEGAVQPFFSPDGTWIGFLANGWIQKTRVDGGPVVTIVRAGSVRGAVWADNDTIVYPSNGISALSAVSASGGTPRALTTLNAGQHERTHRLPSLMTDGNTVLFTVGTLANPEDYDDATIEAVRLDTGERKVVLRGGRMPTYTAAGDLLYVRGSVLYGVALDPRRLELRGRPRPIIDNLLGDPTTGAAFFAASDSGILTYVPGHPSAAARRLAWVDRDGKANPIDLPPARYTEPHVSPDGSRIAFSIVVEGSRDRDIWVADPVRGTSNRLTSVGTNWTPIWSADGRRSFRCRTTVKKTAHDRGEVGGRRRRRGRIGAFDGIAFLTAATPDGAALLLSLAGQGMRFASG